MRKMRWMRYHPDKVPEYTEVELRTGEVGLVLQSGSLAVPGSMMLCTDDGNLPLPVGTSLRVINREWEVHEELDHLLAICDNQEP